MALICKSDQSIECPEDILEVSDLVTISSRGILDYFNDDVDEISTVSLRFKLNGKEVKNVSQEYLVEPGKFMVPGNVDDDKVISATYSLTIEKKDYKFQSILEVYDKENKKISTNIKRCFFSGYSEDEVWS